MRGRFASTKLDEQYSAYTEFPKTQSSEELDDLPVLYKLKETQAIQSNV